MLLVSKVFLLLRLNTQTDNSEIEYIFVHYMTYTPHLTRWIIGCAVHL